MLNRTKKTDADQIPVFRPGVVTATGGFRLLVDNLTAGDIVAAGAAISYDENERTARVIKGLTVQANVAANATAVPVAKNSLVKVGDIVGLKAAKGKASTVTAIDKSNALFDTITISAALGAMVAGDALFQAAAETAGADSALVAPFDKEHGGLNKNSILVEAGQVQTVDVVIRGEVYARRIPAITAEMKAALPTIIFSNSK